MTGYPIRIDPRQIQTQSSTASDDSFLIQVILHKTTGDPHRLAGKANVGLRQLSEFGRGESHQIHRRPVAEPNRTLDAASVADHSTTTEREPMKVVDPATGGTHQQ